MKDNIVRRSLRILLAPLALIFLMTVMLRNWLYDHKILKTIVFSIPIISVGNISTGGTGKTPFIIYISEYYLKKGKNIGIISRGYGRKSDDLVLVSDGENIYASPEESGDEVSMIAQYLIKRYNNFTVISSADRIKAAQYLINNYACDIILLDDAFQHRKIFRNLDFVLIDGMRFNHFSDKIVLPAGNLREPMNSIARCDLIIFNNKFCGDKLIDNNILKYEKPVIFTRYLSIGFFNYRDEILYVLNKKAILFCGIAEPASFVEAANNSGVDIIKSEIFRDHKDYKESDLEKIEKLYASDIIFLTTEKDFVKLSRFKEFLNKYPVYYLKMKMEITTNEIALNNNLDKLIN